jgi:hypothetical protein
MCIYIHINICIYTCIYIYIYVYTYSQLDCESIFYCEILKVFNFLRYGAEERWEKWDAFPAALIFLAKIAVNILST